MEQSRSTEEIMGGGVTHHLWSILGVQRWERGAKEIWGRQVHSLWWGGVQLELPPSQQQPGELFLAEFAGAPRQHR